MPDEITSPATAGEAPTPESAQQSGSAPEQTPTMPAVGAAPTPATEPDLDALFKNPEYRKRLFEHPEVATEFQRHRSEGGRRAKADLDAANQRLQQLEQWYRDQETTRIQSMEDDEAGQAYKQKIAEQKRMAELQAIHTEAGRQAALQFVKLMGDRIEKYLDPEERAALEWTKFNDPGEYMDAVFDALPKKQAEKLAKELAKKEVEAITQERLAAERETAPVIPTTPQGGAAPTMSEFLRDFASGGNNDTQRARALLKEIGLSF